MSPLPIDHVAQRLAALEGDDSLRHIRSTAASP
jgi:hypothetical protein